MMKLKIGKRYTGTLFLLFLVVLFSLVPEYADAQCPMCRIAAESNMENGGTAGMGLNRGIFYLLGMPYVFIGVIGYIWWRSRKKKAEMERELDQEV